MLVNLLIVFLIAITYFSWHAFFQAAKNPNLIYLPFENFLFTNTIDESHNLFNKAWYILTDFSFKIISSTKIINEISMWVFVIIAGLCFIQILSCHEWLSYKSKKNSFKELSSFFKKFSISISTKNNIFNLEFKNITKISFCLATIFIFLIPNDSSDIFGYIARGAQQVFFEQNPYQNTITQIDNWQSFSLLSNINPIWAQNPSPYGPLFMGLCALIAFVSMGNLTIAVLAFKLFNLAIFVCLLITITKILNNKKLNETIFLKRHKEQRQLYSYKKIIYSLIALNPFIMVEVFWNAHNDLLMGFLILLAVYNCFIKKANSAFIFLTISVLCKYLSIILLPFFIIYLRQDKAIKFPLLGSLTSFALILGSWFIYQPLGAQVTQISNNALLCHKSLLRLLNTVYKVFSKTNLPNYSSLIMLSLFAIVIIYLYFIFSITDKNNFINFCFISLFLLIFVFSAKFHSWYFLMLVPVGALILPRLIFLLSLSHLLSLTFLDQANAINFILLTFIPCLLYIKLYLEKDLSS